MKVTKRIAAVLLALVMVLSLSVSAFAASGTNSNSGTITINNAVVNQTYTIYQILKLESYNADANAYAYKATTAWETFINGTGIKGTYVNVDSQGYVTWVKDADAAKFAELAQAYATQHGIANQGSQKADSTTVEFTRLNLGYYLLDSSLGTLCSLDTTNPSVTINEKNKQPTNEKQVVEDSTGNLGSRNDADIGQMVKFVSKVTIPVGSENVVFHDKMSDGLTLVKGEEGKTGVTVYTDAGLAAKDILPDANWIQNVPGKDEGCTFEIDFANYLDLVTKDTTLYIVYYATVNEKAVVGSEGNPNESWLSYGEDGKTTSTPSKTTTYTWEINVFKYTMVNSEEKALAGAQFILYKDVKSGETTTRYYAVAAAVDGGYRFTEWTTNEASATKFVTPADGKFAIKGLDSDTYYLEEIVAPDGYNKLSGPVTVVINDQGEVTYNGTSTGTVKVLNNTGAELPSTGGIGTTIFYVLGGILVVGAAVVLTTRKRMEKNAK